MINNVGEKLKNTGVRTASAKPSPIA